MEHLILLAIWVWGLCTVVRSLAEGARLYETVFVDERTGRVCTWKDFRLRTRVLLIGQTTFEIVYFGVGLFTVITLLAHLCGFAWAQALWA